jgi:hypothetical protein
MNKITKAANQVSLCNIQYCYMRLYRMFENCIHIFVFCIINMNKPRPPPPIIDLATPQIFGFAGTRFRFIFFEIFPKLFILELATPPLYILYIPQLNDIFASILFVFLH